MINLPCTIGTCTIQYGRHHLESYFVGMKTVVMPDYDTSIMYQMLENIFSVTYNGIMVVVPIDEYQIKLLSQDFLQCLITIFGDRGL